jgi:hypothetical protein
MTYEGCPVPQPKFTSRPSASRMIRLPSGNTNVIDLRLDVVPAVLPERRDLDFIAEMPDVCFLSRSHFVYGTLMVQCNLSATRVSGPTAALSPL